jgi:S1-C subfamily serine protease
LFPKGEIALFELKYLRLTIYILAAAVSIAVNPLTSISAAEQGEQKESFYSQLIRAVVRLEEHQSICTQGREWAIERDVPVGSAFFVRDRMQGQGETEVNRYFVVTARHVVEHRAELFARVQVEPSSPETAVLRLPRDLWVFHPTPAPQDKFPIDVAVMLIHAPPFLKAFLHCTSDDNPAGCGINEATKKPFENQLGEPPRVMDRAIFFGFPGGDVASQAVDPFARAGIVAYMAVNPDLRIDGRPLSDAPAFPGNSGGPLLREQLPLRGGVHLWGLVTGGSTIGKDYAIVTSVQRIHETLVYARVKATFNREAWYSKPPRLPIKCVSDTENRPN